MKNGDKYCLKSRKLKMQNLRLQISHQVYKLRKLKLQIRGNFAFFSFPFIKSNILYIVQNDGNSPVINKTHRPSALNIV